MTNKKKATILVSILFVIILVVSGIKSVEVFRENRKFDSVSKFTTDENSVTQLAISEKYEAAYSKMSDDYRKTVTFDKFKEQFNAVDIKNTVVSTVVIDEASRGVSYIIRLADRNNTNNLVGDVTLSKLKNNKTDKADFIIVRSNTNQ